jgi:hypothetical protein
LPWCGDYADLGIAATIPPARLLPSNLVLPLFCCV